MLCCKLLPGLELLVGLARTSAGSSTPKFGTDDDLAGMRISLHIGRRPTIPILGHGGRVNGFHLLGLQRLLPGPPGSLCWGLRRLRVATRKIAQHPQIPFFFRSSVTNAPRGGAVNCAQVKFLGIPFRSQRTLSAHPSPLGMSVFSSSLTVAPPSRGYYKGVLAPRSHGLSMHPNKCKDNQP